jgi:hypothetical protein
MSLKQRVLFLFLVLCMSVVPALAQRKGKKTPPPLSPAQANENAKAQAQELGDAMLKEDYARAADLTLPKLVALMGGKQAYIAQLKQGMGLPDSFRVIATLVGEPRDSITHANQIVVIVPSTMRMKVPEGVLVGEAFYIGVSTDGGRNWKFLGGDSDSDKNQLMHLLPGVADKIKLPEVKRPVLYRGLDK